MTTLAEEAAEWKDNRAQGVYPLFHARLPYGVREFWKKRGTARFPGIEITNRLGFAIDFGKHANWHLHLCLGWPVLFITLPFQKLRDRDDWDVNERTRGYGVSYFDRQFYVKCGFWQKFIPAPWSVKVVRREWLRADGVWIDADAEDAALPGENGLDAWARRRDERRAVEYVEVEDFWYHPPGMETQRGKARLTVDRHFTRPLWRSWLPILTRERWGFTCDFSCEVGNQAGSWKGGVLGCGGEIKRGETLTEAFQRMMRERKFDR